MLAKRGKIQSRDHRLWLGVHTDVINYQSGSFDRWNRFRLMVFGESYLPVPPQYGALNRGSTRDCLRGWILAVLHGRT